MSPSPGWNLNCCLCCCLDHHDQSCCSPCLPPSPSAVRNTSVFLPSLEGSDTVDYTLPGLQQAKGVGGADHDPADAPPLVSAV